jgi:hypothetical protein
MVTIANNCVTALRLAPLASAIDTPWDWLEHHGLAKESVIQPTVEFSVGRIQQTFARICFAFLLPHFAKCSSYFNLGLGAIHVLWCIKNFKKFREGGQGFERQDLEKAFVRLFTGAYDLAIFLFFSYSFPGSGYFKPAVQGGIALFPQPTMQLHQLVFKKGEIPPDPPPQPPKEGSPPPPPLPPKIDYFHLHNDCLIQQLAQGVTDMILWKPAPPVENPPAKGPWYAFIFNLWPTKAPVAPQPAENT